MGRLRASEVAKQLRELGENTQYGRTRPEVTVRPDAPGVTVNDATPVGNVLNQLDPAGHGMVLRDERGKPAAVILPIERYADLASCEIESEGRWDAAFGAMPEALEELMIQQVDPGVRWQPGSRLMAPLPDQPRRRK